MARLALFLLLLAALAMAVAAALTLARALRPSPLILPGPPATETSMPRAVRLFAYALLLILLLGVTSGWIGPS